MTLHMLTYGNFNEGLAILNDDGRIGTLLSDWPNLRVSCGRGDNKKIENAVEGSGWGSVVLCDECQNLIYRDPESASTGYNTNDKGQHFCYACCAEYDRKTMRENGKHHLYYVKKDGQWVLSNFDGSLIIKAVTVTSSKNIRQAHHISARMYVAFTFTFEGQRWYGRCQGDQDLAWVKRYKEKK